VVTTVESRLVCGLARVDVVVALWGTLRIVLAPCGFLASGARNLKPEAGVALTVLEDKEGTTGLTDGNGTAGFFSRAELEVFRWRVPRELVMAGV